MALGKAFIEVHADTKPFARELASELDKIIRAAEKNVKISASKVGETISKETSKGIDKNQKKIGNSLGNALNSAFGSNLGLKFTQGIIDSLDDGLSGLPAEVKVALGAALVAILPFIGAAVTALLNVAVIGAFAALGVLVASQFQTVQDRWTVFVDQLRELFVNAGQGLVEPVLNTLDLIQTRLEKLRPWFEEIFTASGQLIEPLANALLNFGEGLLPGLLDSLRNVRGTLDQLQAGFYNLGRAIGSALDIISGSDYADDAFKDLVLVLGSAVLSAALFIRTLTEIYGRLRDISLLLSGPKGIAQLFAQNAADDYANDVNNATDANGGFEQSLTNLLAPTKDQAKAVETLNAQIARLQQLTLAQVNNDIAWEQAIDDLTTSVQENGRSLNLTKQAGRDNARALVELANVALRTRADTIALTGDTGRANAKFEEQKKAIYDLAKQMKLSKTDTDKLVGALLSIPAPQESGISQNTINRLIYAISLAKSFGAALGSAVGVAVQLGATPHANGGVYSTPHVGLVAEAGPEAIIPLDNPARASQIMAQSGLDQMTGPQVNVYIGNQQIDAYIDNRVRSATTVVARELAYGGRGI